MSEEKEISSAARRRWLTRAEAADVARCSLSTIDRARRAGELRAGGTAGRVLIHRQWLDEWLENGDGRGAPPRERVGSQAMADDPEVVQLAQQAAAREAGVPEGLSHRITGATLQEMRDDARALARELGIETSAEGSARDGRGRFTNAGSVDMNRIIREASGRQ